MNVNGVRQTVSTFAEFPITYAGAAYLVVLGVSRVVTAARAARDERAMAEPSTIRGSLVLQGFLALNPKTALFFLALFPQWIDPRAGPAWMQMLSSFSFMSARGSHRLRCAGQRTGKKK